MMHTWRTYDMELAQIRTFEFESENGIVHMTVELMEEMLREKNYIPAEEFDRAVGEAVKVWTQLEGAG